MFKLIIAAFAVLVTASSFAQNAASRTYSGGFDETGTNITTDSAGNIYLLSNIAFGDYQGVKLRKVDRDGVMLADTTFDDGEDFDLYAKDIIINQDGNIVVVYMRDKSGDLVFDQQTFLKITEFNNNLSFLRRKEIILSTRAFSRAQAHISQLSDSDYALMSPEFASENPQSSKNVLSRLDSSFELKYSVDLNSLPGTRVRCFSSVEDDNIIIGGPSADGGNIVKVDLLDSVIVWENTLPLNVAGFVRIYNVLETDQGYGFVTNHSDIVDSLSGVSFFKTDLSGNVTDSTLFNENPFSSVFFPQLSKGECNDFFVNFRVSDTTSNIKTRSIRITADGIVESDIVIDFIEGEEFVKEYARFSSDSIIGVGESRDESGATSTLLVKQLTCARVTASDDLSIAPAEPSIVLYPNPVTGGELYLKTDVIGPDRVFNYEILTTNGQKVASGVVNSSSPVNTSILGCGMYILLMRSGNHSFTSKFVVYQ